MEINIIPVSGVPQFNAPVVKTVSADPAPVVAVPEPVPQVQFPAATISTADATPSASFTQQQAEAERQAALSFKNFYAISDTASATFKDATGALITRTVSLRDGTVTYVPQPQYVKPQQTAGISIDA